MGHKKLVDRKEDDVKAVTPAYDKAPDARTNDPKPAPVGHGQGGKGH